MNNNNNNSLDYKNTRLIPIQDIQNS